MRGELGSWGKLEDRQWGKEEKKRRKVEEIEEIPE